MSNSDYTFDPLIQSNAGHASTANAFFDAASPATLYGRRQSTSSGLTWGYYGGTVLISGTPTQIDNDLLLLTASSTNYVEADPSDGSVSHNTSAFTSGFIQLYTVVTGTDTVTSYTDWRTSLSGAGSGSVGDTLATEGALINSATSKTTPVDADYIGLMDSAASNILKKLSWANVKATLKTYFDTLYAPLSQPLVVVPFYPGAPTASALMCLFAAPAGITTLTFSAALAGSSGKALTAATAQTDFDVRKDATTSANGTSVGTIRFAAGDTVPTFIAAAGFTLTGGTNWLSVWAPATPDATIANISASLYCTRS